MQKLTSLFLSQSYQDTWDDYKRSLTTDQFPGWDYIILTASNENQAEGYRRQLEDRKDYLPVASHFAVIPDEGGMRVGSGGATLSVMRYVYRQEEKKTGRGHFDGLRILVIHSGGDSKRVPTYSALGKLFSPVPHTLADGRSSTLFDELMIAMASVACRIREGMVLLSGDVLLLFNPLQIDFSGKGAAAISFKEKVEIGKNHGVFLNGDRGNVRRFLHKQTVETLRAVGAVNESDCVDIDTGAVIFAPDMLESLYSLVDTQEKYEALVNDKVRLSLYGDFLYPLAEDSSLEDFYREKPEGSLTPELHQARTQVWQVLHCYRMKLLRLAPAKFIHFGTTWEILGLMTGGIDAYQDLGWRAQVGSSVAGLTPAYNSVLSENASMGQDGYLEVSCVHHNARVGRHVFLSHIDIHDVVVPDGVVLHGLKQKDGRFVCRIYGIQDNPKEDVLFGVTLSRQLEKLGTDAGELWGEQEHTLWTAKLYPQCDTVQDSVLAALNLYNLLHGSGDAEAWRRGERKSLCAGLHDADSDAIIAWDKRMQQLVQMTEITERIRKKVPAAQQKRMEPLTHIQQQWLESFLQQADVFDRMRMQYYVGTALGTEGNTYIRDCFDTISAAVQSAAMKELQYNTDCRIVKDSHQVRLPLRVNWGGGWSDTPPICCEIGGTVLNAAICLNGQLPVEVTLVKIPQKKIVFDSRDMDVHGEFDTIEPLQAVGDPYDPFALQKACLLACGILPASGGSLEEILTRLGGGFEIHSEFYIVS